MEEARGGDEARLGRYEQMRMELSRGKGGVQGGLRVHVQSPIGM